MSFKASSAVAQAHTQVNSGSLCKNSMKLSRMTRLSSTMAILVMGLRLRLRARLRLMGGDMEAHGRAASLRSFDFKTSTQLLDARPHVGHAIHILGAGTVGQTAPIVGDGHLHFPVVAAHVHADFG